MTGCEKHPNDASRLEASVEINLYMGNPNLYRARHCQLFGFLHFVYLKELHVNFMHQTPKQERWLSWHITSKKASWVRSQGRTNLL